MTTERLRTSDFIAVFPYRLNLVELASGPARDVPPRVSVQTYSPIGAVSAHAIQSRVLAGCTWHPATETGFVIGSHVAAQRAIPHLFVDAEPSTSANYL